MIANSKRWLLIGRSALHRIEPPSNCTHQLKSTACCAIGNTARARGVSIPVGILTIPITVLCYTNGKVRRYTKGNCFVSLPFTIFFRFI
jgi:hypothetical protein